MPDAMSRSETIASDTLPEERSGLFAALHDLQETHGYVPRSEALALSRRMSIPLARIFEVLTFYNYFRLEKPGHTLLTVCQGTSCHLQGGPVLLKALEDLLGVRAGEATPDGAYQLSVVSCLGCCSLSPVLMVDDTVYSKVQPSDLPGILRKHAGRAAESEGGHANSED